MILYSSERRMLRSSAMPLFLYGKEKRKWSIKSIYKDNRSGGKHANIRQIWNKYDDDHSGKMEIKEFMEFIKEIKLNINGLTVEELYHKVDSDKSGKIDFNEFLIYLDEITSAKEFENDFNLYSGKKNYWDINDLIKFMTEVQCETKFGIYEAINMILYYNKEMDQPTHKKIEEKLEKLKSSLKPDLSDWEETEVFYFKFRINMLQNYMIHRENSINNIVDHPMDYPTNDYFVYSSHNTYLKGHQLYGESAVEMYSYAINMGCRCVELDCWDGKNNEPKITHGMTFTSDILFKDVIQTIKDNAFKKTDTPFFLSIEMHCGEEQQKIMANYFKNILVDIWTPENDGVPEYFPTPLQLRKKFIVKCKKPKVMRKNTVERRDDREHKYMDTNPSVVNRQLNIKRNLSVIKETEEYELSKRGTFAIESDRPSFLASKTINSKRLEEQKTIKSKDVNLHDVSGVHEEKSKEEQEKIAKETIKNKKKTIKEVVPDLYDKIGLISVHLKLEDLTGENYQPWDVVSLSEGKVSKYMKNDKDREKLLNFTSNSFLRVYPAGTRIDSSNYDPVKSWIVGGQLVSLNLQSLNDDYTLLNHIFFKTNNERGYVLKPKYLRGGSLVNRDYKKPSFKLRFEVLSGIMLQKCLKESSKELYVSVSVIGTFEDDKNEPIRTDPVRENFLHPKFSQSVKEFNIHEDNLSFLFIKLIDNDNQVLARSVVPMMTMLEGYRNVHLYDDFCQEVENSILIVRIKKIS